MKYKLERDPTHSIRNEPDLFRKLNFHLAELEQASLKAQRLNAITALYRSVGGGWQ